MGMDEWLALTAQMKASGYSPCVEVTSSRAVTAGWCIAWISESLEAEFSFERFVHHDRLRAYGDG